MTGEPLSAYTGEPLSTYEAWDMRPPATPPHSRLYHLAPVGVGTPVVESLTGYLSRLAMEHGVALRPLMRQEILPHLRHSHLLARPDRSFDAFWRTDARAMNGPNTTADDWVRALTALTRRQDLRYLTLLPWAALLPARGLLRPTLAWCPACYEEWRVSGQIVYQPLLWTLAVVTACPHHRRPLRLQCPRPTCRRAQFPLDNHAEPGHCARCGGWLGAAEDPNPKGRDDLLAGVALAWQAWVGTAVGELLAAAPTQADGPHREEVAAAIADAAAQLGGVKALGRAVDIHFVRVAQWRQGRDVPSLPWLLHLCYRLGTSPLRFMTERPAALHPVPAGPELLPSRPVPLHPPRPRNSFDIDRARQLLRRVLDAPEEPPPSARQLAHQLACNPTTLYYHLPEECSAISARYLTYRRQKSGRVREQRCAEIRQATEALHGQGLYPSAKRVARLVGRPAALRRPEALATRHAVLRELGWEM